MFTGIIESLGRIKKISDGQKFELETGFKDLVLGESVAINGVCLTVAEFHLDHAIFLVSPETLDRTHFSELKEGSIVNLERALLPTTRLSGHLVQGHVDGIALLKSARPVELSCFEIVLELPASLTRYCVEKGSIALNGVSLTINQISGNVISLMLIPHTWEHTSFSKLDVGARVNVEVDVTAKYLEKLCQPYLKH